MIPILYDKDKTTFTRDSIGFLTDCISCTVDEERNDQYELEMVYPVGGALYDKIEQDAIIKAKPNNQDAPQPFRIYRISKQLNGRVTVYARHIVYDLSKVTVEPFTSSGTITDAIQGMIDHAIPSCGFSFDTEKTTEGNYKVSAPTSFRALMGGVRGSLLDVFGTGEYHYDGYDINLLLNRGQDRGVVIRYGISMVDMKQEEECENVYTAVYPYWQFADKFVSLNERIISVGEFPFSRIMILDLSSEFQNEPTQAQLREKAQQYINEHDIKPEQLLSDYSLQWLVTTPLYNIGEHVYNLSPAFKEQHGDIQWGMIAGMRHRLVHDYDGTNWNIIVEVIYDELPLFISQLEELF